MNKRMKVFINHKLIFVILVCLASYIIFLGTKFLILSLMFRDISYGPLTLKEVKETVVFLPLHVVNPTAKHSDLEEIYYFFDDRPELTLLTYFTTQDKNKEFVRVAEMASYNQKGGMAPFEMTDRRISINWAITNNTGYVCKVLSNAYVGEKISGSPYQTCVYWFDEHNQYILYTIWTEEETEEFVNSLIRVK